MGKHEQQMKADLSALMETRQVMAKESGVGVDKNDDFMFTIGLGTDDRVTAIRRSEIVMKAISVGLICAERAIKVVENAEANNAQKVAIHQSKNGGRDESKS